MTELLERVGFSEGEVQRYKAGIEIFSKIVCADEIRCSAALQMLPENFDLSFESIRRLLKILLETVFQDLEDQGGGAEGPALWQGAVPFPVAAALAIDELNPHIRISSSEYLIIYLSGVLFNRFESLCSPGEHSCGRCGLNLSREKLYRNPLYPRPRGILTCLGYCDEIYKTGETLSEQYGADHVHFKGLPGLEYGEQKVYLGEGLRGFMMQQTGAPESDVETALGRCNDGMLEISLLLNRINRLAAEDRDVYATFNELSLLNLFHLICLPRHFEQGKEILNSFIRELKQKKRAGEAALKEPFRIGCLHLPFTNPFLDRCFRNSGAAVIVSSFYETGGSAVPSENEYERCLHGYYGFRAPGDLNGKAGHIDRIIEDYSLDAFLFGQFENDRALGGDQRIIIKRLKHKRKAHYMGMDNWSVMGERESTRIESLAALMMEREKKYKER